MNFFPWTFRSHGMNIRNTHSFISFPMGIFTDFPIRGRRETTLYLTTGFRQNGQEANNYNCKNNVYYGDTNNFCTPSRDNMSPSANRRDPPKTLQLRTELPGTSREYNRIYNTLNDYTIRYYTIPYNIILYHSISILYLYYICIYIYIYIHTHICICDVYIHMYVYNIIYIYICTCNM